MRLTSQFMEWKTRVKQDYTFIDGHSFQYLSRLSDENLISIKLNSTSTETFPLYENMWNRKKKVN